MSCHFVRRRLPALVGGALGATLLALAAVAHATPVPTFTPSPIDFGKQAVKTTGAPVQFVVFNPGPGQITFTGSTLSGPFVAVELPSFPVTLPQHSTVFGKLAFAPTASGAVKGKLSFKVLGGPDATVDLVGTGYTPVLGVTPASLGYGTVATGTTKSLDLLLKSSGDGPVTVSGLGLVGAAPGDFVLLNAPKTPFSIPAGTTFTLKVGFRPMANGARNATLHVVDDDPQRTTVDVPLAGAGTGSTIGASPSPLDLGAVQVNSTGMATLTVTNSGDVDLDLTAITIGGDNPGDFATTAKLPLHIAAGDSAKVPFTFTPTGGGQRKAVATLVSTDGLKPMFDVPLVGVGGGASLVATPNAIDYGPLAVQTSSTVSLKITDQGAGPLTILSLSIAGADASAFTVGDVTLPVTLKPNETLAVPVTFAPTAVKAYAARLTIGSNDTMTPTYDVPLAGVGASPHILASPTSLDFGGQLQGKSSAARSVSLFNDAGVPLTISAIAIKGANPGSFAIVTAPKLPLVLKPGQSASVDVAFQPPSAGPVSATLAVGSNDVATPELMIPLKGTGTTTAFVVEPASFDFGTVEVPGSLSKSLVVTNTSGAAITFASPTLTGMKDAFQVTGAGGTIPAGGSQTVTVTFRADAVGTFAADLTFKATDDTLPPAVVSLKGVGGALVSVTPTALDFGMVTVKASATLKLSVTNSGTRFVQVQAVTSTQPVFRAVGSLPPIGPNATAVIDVVFEPQAAGDVTADLSVTFVGGLAPPAAVTAKGTGVAPPPMMAPMPSGCAVGGARSAGGAGAGLAALALALLGAGAVRMRRARRRAGAAPRA